MKVKIEEINKEKGIEAGELTESGVYHGTYNEHDRIIVVKDYEKTVLVIKHNGEILSLEKHDVVSLYTGMRKINDLKIEFEA